MNDLLIRTEGFAGRITLNRPAALNALTHAMCLEIEAALQGWVQNADVALVIIDGQGERAFCAGGDVIAIYNDGMAGRDAAARQFWRDEYRLDALIANYPKPYVAIMDGIVMGGGVGLSAHGSCRIVTERTVLAMPECGLGLIPDVGGSLLLANMPGHCGEYVGLTGTRLDGADAIYGGFADHFVPASRIDALVAVLCSSRDWPGIAAFEIAPPASKLSRDQEKIDAIFALADLAGIRAALSQDQSELGAKARAAVETGAPLSHWATLSTIRAARVHRSLSLALRDEFRFVSRSVLHGELLEGIRAALVDKDRRPRWRHGSFEDIPASLLSLFSGAPDDGDLIP